MKNVDPYNARYYEAHPTLPSLPPAHCKPRAYRQVHLTKTPRSASLRHMWTVQTWYAPRSHAFCLVFFLGGRVLVANTVKDVLLVCCLMRQGSAAPPFRNVLLSSLSIPGQKKQVLKVCLLKPWFSKYP